MSNANESMVREAYALFAKGDLDSVFKLCTPNITFRFPGQGLLSGEHTQEQFRAKIGTAMGALKGTFHEEILRMVVSDTDAWVLVAQRAERDGKLHTWTAIKLFEIKDGQLAGFRLFIEDYAAYDAVWHL